MLNEQQYQATISHEAFNNMNHAVLLAQTQADLAQARQQIKEAVGHIENQQAAIVERQATIDKQQATIEAKSADIESVAKYLDMTPDAMLAVAKPVPVGEVTEVMEVGATAEAATPLPTLTDVADAEFKDPVVDKT